jgi:hypothetical protein
VWDRQALKATGRWAGRQECRMYCKAGGQLQEGIKGSRHEEGGRHADGQAGNAYVRGMADERADRLEERQTAGGLADGQAGEVRSRASRWVCRQAGGQVDRQAGSADGQAVRCADGHAGGQEGRRTGNG